MLPLIQRKLYCESWCVTPAQHQAMQQALESHVKGGSSVVAPRTNHFNAAGLGLAVPKSHGSRVYTRGSLAYIPVSGIMGKGLSMLEMMCGGYSIDQVQADTETALEDGNIKRILFDFDSPGGQVTGVPEAARVIAEASKIKETIGFTASQSCSAAYWLMSQCKNLYATESASVGSIGVYLALLDRSEEMKQKGNALKLFKAGKHKGMGLPGNPLTEDDEQLLQEGVDRVYKMFTSAVTSARPKVSKETMQGQTFMGLEAKKAGLVDAMCSNLTALVKRLS